MSIFLYLFGNMEKTGGWGQPNFACYQFTWLVQVTCTEAFELHLLLPPSYHIFTCDVWHVGCWFPNQGWTRCPLQWKWSLNH